MAPLLQQGPRYLGIHGGRGGGKSWTFADLLVARMVQNQDLSAVCCRETQRSLEHSVKRTIEQKIRSHGVEDYFDVKATQIRAKRGSGLVIFNGLSDHTSESIKSLEGFDVAWIEEAQAISKRSLDLLRPTIRKPRSQIWASWNPVHDTDPIDVLFRGPNKPRDAAVVEAHYYHNPWFPDSLRAEAEYDRQTDPEKFAHVWLGGYLKHSEARVFRNWKVEEFETPKDAVLRFGVDWGFSPDPTVLIRGFVQGRQLFLDYEAYQVQCEIEDTPSLFLTVPQSELYMLNCASDRPERVKSLQRAGFKAKAIPREPHSVQEGVDFLRGFQVIIHPRCKHAIDEFRLYSRKIDPITSAVLPILEDKNNHVIDATRHLIDDVRRMVKAKPQGGGMTPVPTVSHWGGR
ncbi:MAG: PBSX family phage terminase large subunit [Elusimicrobiota bacterium]